MRTALLAASLLAASASLASAGTYVSLGVGGAPSGQGTLAVASASGDSDVPQQRLGLGQRFGRIAVEASLGRFGIGPGDARAAGVHARVTLPLDGHFGLFGRLGYERVWLRGLETRMGDSADGTIGGVGLEYRVTAPLLGEASVWADVSQDSLTFADDTQGGVRMWTVGATLGL